MTDDHIQKVILTSAPKFIAFLGSVIYRELVFEWQQLVQPWHLVEGHWRTA